LEAVGALVLFSLEHHPEDLVYPGNEVWPLPVVFASISAYRLQIHELRDLGDSENQLYFQCKVSHYEGFKSQLERSI
jgi:hypothetical protein